MKVELNADVGTVAGLLSDPDFIKERSAAIGELSCEAEVSGDDEAFTVKTTRVVERELPSVLAKMFDSKQTMVMTENWRWVDDGYEGDFVAEIPGQPLLITAKFTVKPKGDASVYDISHKVKAKIPLIGGRVEKFVMSQLGDGFKEEMDYAKSRL